MLAVGFTRRKIQMMILSEQILILFAGVSTGVIAALVSTLPSIMNSPDIPWIYLCMMIFAIVATGLVVILLTIRSIMRDSLIASLKKE